MFCIQETDFSGLGMSFFSYCTFRFKLNCVWTLMSRAYIVCTSCILFQNELCFLKVFFCNNGGNTKFVEKLIQKILNKQYNPSGFDAPFPSILKKKFSLPYFVQLSEKLRSELVVLSGRHFSDVRFKCSVSEQIYSWSSFQL